MEDACEIRVKNEGGGGGGGGGGKEVRSGVKDIAYLLGIEVVFVDCNGSFGVSGGLIGELLRFGFVFGEELSNGVASADQSPQNFGVL